MRRRLLVFGLLAGLIVLGGSWVVLWLAAPRTAITSETPNTEPTDPAGLAAIAVKDCDAVSDLLSTIRDEQSAKEKIVELNTVDRKAINSHNLFIGVIEKAAPEDRERFLTAFTRYRWERARTEKLLREGSSE